MYEFFRENLNYFLAERKVKPSKLSTLIGVSQPTLSRMTSDKTDYSKYVPDHKNVVEIANWLGVSPDDLANKDLTKAHLTKPKIKQFDMHAFMKKHGMNESNATMTDIEMKVYEDGDPVPDGYVAIDFYSEIKGSAGNGYLNIEHSSPQKIYVPVSEIIKYDANPETSKTFIIDGESMLPELKPGFPITIDMSAKRIVDGQIYAFLKGDELKVKFLHSWNDEGQGGFIAKSSNPDKNRYPDEFYSPQRIENDCVEILGQYWLKIDGTKVRR